MVLAVVTGWPVILAGDVHAGVARPEIEGGKGQRV
jgi:hypothetical protein